MLRTAGGFLVATTLSAAAGVLWSAGEKGMIALSSFHVLALALLAVGFLLGLLLVVFSLRPVKACVRCGETWPSYFGQLEVETLGSLGADASGVAGWVCRRCSTGFPFGPKRGESEAAFVKRYVADRTARAEGEESTPHPKK